MPLEQWPYDLWDHVELFKVELLPGDGRIWLQTGLPFLAGLVDGFVNLFQLTAYGVRNDLRPQFIGFAQSDCIRMTRTAISPQGLVGYFRNVRAPHHNRHARGANGISHAVGPGHHSGHRANTHESDLLLLDKAHELLLVHWPGIAVNQKYLMFGRGQ